jgi:hypothetical protein
MVRPPAAIARRPPSCQKSKMELIFLFVLFWQHNRFYNQIRMSTTPGRPEEVPSKTSARPPMTPSKETFSRFKNDEPQLCFRRSVIGRDLEVPRHDHWSIVTKAAHCGSSEKTGCPLEMWRVGGLLAVAASGITMSRLK